MRSISVPQAGYMDLVEQPFALNLAFSRTFVPEATTAAATPSSYEANGPFPVSFSRFVFKMVYSYKQTIFCYIRLWIRENWASRPLRET
jgi:hypothetical protein